LGEWVAPPLGRRAFDVLEVLLQASGRLVSKSDIFKRAWRGLSVDDNTLHVHISALRRRFGADAGLIKTASGRGYRPIGTWTFELRTGAPDQPVIRPEVTRGNLLGAITELTGRAAAVTIE
jgi:non-specific serine/threonine protein kinase